MSMKILRCSGGDWSRACGLAGLAAITVLLFCVSSASAFEHVHVQISYVSGQWNLFIYDYERGRLPAATNVLKVLGVARSSVPNDPRYTNFLGRAGSPVWTLPQTDTPPLISLGVGTSDIAPNVFFDNELKLHLRRVEGPGHFAMYTYDPLGAPNLLMASLDGINSSTDVLTVPAVSAHIHMNWAFTAPGTFRIGFSASGVLRSNGQLSQSPIVDYTFVVVPPAPRLESPRLQPNADFAYTLHSEPGINCRIEQTADFNTWVVSTNVLNPSGVMLLELPFVTPGPIFYRAVLP